MQIKVEYNVINYIKLKSFIVTNVATNGCLDTIRGACTLFDIKNFEMIIYLIFNFIGMLQLDEHHNTIKYSNTLPHGGFDI